MKKLSFTLFFLLTLFVSTFGQEAILQFNKKGTFKIVQFTDLHFDLRTEKHLQTLETMRAVLKKEQPDFVILTGDLIWSEPAKITLLELTKPVVEAEVPWTVAFGNHDVEFDMTKEAIWKLFKTLPHFVGEVGKVSGVGNNVFPILASDGKELVSAIFTLDSQAYSKDKVLYGGYDWIKFDQITWYRNESDKLAEKNNGKLLPSIMFFHIPITEFHAVADNEGELVGEKLEGVADSHINSGLFASMIDKENIMGVFVGHDHDNNYVGLHKNIALGFGQVTGADAYGRLERGGRVIELYENKPNTFKTWITTPTTQKHPFYFPSGLSEPNKDTEILPAQDVNPTKNGVRYAYYENIDKIKTTAQIDKFPITSKGVLPNFSLSPAKVKDHFAFKFETWIKIPKTGLYKFYTYSDDGSMLYIDGKLVVDNDGGHSARYRKATVGLEEGFHKLEVHYFEDYMGEMLQVGMVGVDILEGKIQDEILYIE